MTVQELKRSLDEAAATLPFHVDDYDRANEAFLRWRVGNDPRARHIVEVWVFCYTRRYFLAKLVQRPSFNAADFERPVGETFRRVMDHLSDVRDPERFVSYVSVVCRSTYINFRRRASRSPRLSLPPERLPEPAVPTPEPLDEHDRILLAYVLTRAIDRLPDSLRTVVQRRLVEEQSYEQIEEETGLPTPTLRSYLSKALQKLREDQVLRDFVEAWHS